MTKYKTSEQKRVEYVFVKKRPIIRSISRIILKVGMGKDGNVICQSGEAVDLSKKDILAVCKEYNWQYAPYEKLYTVNITDKGQFVRGFVARRYKTLRQLTVKDYKRLK